MFKFLKLISIISPGDPDNYKLRKIEQNVVIPKIVRERAKYEKCSEENKGIITRSGFVIYW